MNDWVVVTLDKVMDFEKKGYEVFQVITDISDQNTHSLVSIIKFIMKKPIKDK